MRIRRIVNGCMALDQSRKANPLKAMRCAAHPTAQIDPPPTPQ